MSEFLGSAWWLLVTLGVLVTLHEFGHFWVARRCGVKVLRFSIGFGKPIWSRIGRDGVEYCIAAIPLGGYVKFLDARESDHPHDIENQPGEYNSAAVWKRIAIALAGPVFNIAFTVLAFWTMFVIGRPDFEPILGTPTGLTAEAGLHAGDRIVSVNDEKIGSFTEAEMSIAESLILHRDADVVVRDAQGNTSSHTIALTKLPAASTINDKTVDAVGLSMELPPNRVESVQRRSPAEAGGLLPEDHIAKINETSVVSVNDVIAAIGDQASKNPTLAFSVVRDGKTVPLTITAKSVQEDGKISWRIGVELRSPQTAVERYGLGRAVPAAFREMWKSTRSTFNIVAGIVSGAASPKNLSSVVGIAQLANASAQRGLAWFLGFLAAISLSLGILNLLPIPILDGGHVLYYLIELVKGSPVSERAVIAGQYVGLALIVALMSVAFYNDILRLVTS